MKTDRETEFPINSAHILEHLNLDTVRTQVRVTGWEETVYLAGRLLVEAGKVEARYVESMKQALIEMGPYAVIAPGIALLHARPEDGVLQPCFALITLSTPVPFGHSENDPVDIVLAFGAVDKKAHLQALQQLAELLSDDDALALIRSAPDEKSLISGLYTWFQEST